MTSLKLYLDKRNKRKDNTYPVKISISHKGKSALIGLDVFLREEQWKNNQVINHPQKQYYNKFLESQKIGYQTELFRLQEIGRLSRMPIQDVRQALLDAMKPVEDDTALFIPYFQKHASTRKAESTRYQYRSTLKLIQAFDKNWSRLTFEDITITWLRKFSDYMNSINLHVNSQNAYMRNIRSAINCAVEEELTTCYPFRKYKMKDLPTIKRSLTREQLHNIMTYSPKNKHLEKYLDAFRLMFMLIGINCVDICALTNENLQNGRLIYQRSKTFKLYDIYLLPEAIQLIEKYRGVEKLVNFGEGERNQKNFTERMRVNLKKISQEMGLPVITSYWARHSWATMAAELDIPKETISAALGHGKSCVTDVYIDFDRKKVDKANRMVLDYVLK